MTFSSRVSRRQVLVGTAATAALSLVPFSRALGFVPDQNVNIALGTPYPFEAYRDAEGYLRARNYSVSMAVLPVALRKRSHEDKELYAAKLLAKYLPKGSNILRAMKPSNQDNFLMLVVNPSWEPVGWPAVFPTMFTYPDGDGLRISNWKPRQPMYGSKLPKGWQSYRGLDSFYEEGQ